MPDTTVYHSGDSFDPSGLILKMTYNNGKESYVTDNYTVNGYDNSKKGNLPLTASYIWAARQAFLLRCFPSRALM